MLPPPPGGAEILGELDGGEEGGQVAASDALAAAVGVPLPLGEETALPLRDTVADADAAKEGEAVSDAEAVGGNDGVKDAETVEVGSSDGETDGSSDGEGAATVAAGVGATPE